MASSFSTLGLKKEILEALESLNFKEPTPVQQEIIPLVLSKQNIAFTSQTGSGKTLAFSVGFFSRLNRKNGVQLLIVVPTRELCQQVGEELKAFGKLLDFNVGMIFGGHALKGDMNTLSKRLHVVVATPGRLIDHINAKTIKVGEVTSLVFDESDQMFDNGFYEDCEYIKSRVSVTAQTILASATMTAKVETFLKKAIKKFKFMEVGVLIPASIIQDVLFCSIEEKNKLLVDFFQGEEFERAIVFANTKAKVESISQYLSKHKLPAAMLSGNLEQKEREKVVRDFKAKKFAILVCSDVASRGLHIEDVDIVLNYDVPTRSEFYIHRIGRTGRNNKKGYALTFICPEDEPRFIEIENEYSVITGEVDHQFMLLDE